jgi:hypothetical protein
MDKHLQQALIDKYPFLCQATKLTIHQSCMAWGFEIGNGWYDLVDELFEKLSKFDGVVLAQVKEKFGVLTVYVDNGSEEVWDLLHEYSNKSSKICETCGNPGKIKGGGWLRAVCPECEKKFEEGKRPWMDNWDE